jgi:hypothetical protein
VRLRVLQHKKTATNAEGSLAGDEAEVVTKVKSFNQCRRFFTGFSVNNRSENVKKSAIL